MEKKWVVLFVLAIWKKKWSYMLFQAFLFTLLCQLPPLANRSKEEKVPSYGNTFHGGIPEFLHLLLV